MIKIKPAIERMFEISELAEKLWEVEMRGYWVDEKERDEFIEIVSLAFDNGIILNDKMFIFLIQKTISIKVLTKRNKNVILVM